MSFHEQDREQLSFAGGQLRRAIRGFLSGAADMNTTKDEIATILSGQLGTRDLLLIKPINNGVIYDFEGIVSLENFISSAFIPLFSDISLASYSIFSIERTDVDIVLIQDNFQQNGRSISAVAKLLEDGQKTIYSFALNQQLLHDTNSNSNSNLLDPTK